MNVTNHDTRMFWGVYGEGIGGLGNDTSFIDSDAALQGSGDLEALEYWSTMIALTHHWSARWRSTAAHGYVELENVGQQAPDAYKKSHYGSVNLIYQVFERMSVGVEGLYGWKKVKNGSSTDVYRVQLGIAFALLD